MTLRTVKEESRGLGEAFLMVIGAIGTWFVAVVILSAILIPVSLWYAYAFSVMWGWFVVPAFGVPTLTMWQTFGIFITLALFRPHINIHKDERPINWSAWWGIGGGPAFSLALGYLIKFQWALT